MQLSISMRCTYFLFNTFRRPYGRTSHWLHLERAPALNYCPCYFSTPRRPPTGAAAADSRRTANASINYCPPRTCSHNTVIVALFSTSKSSFVPPDPPSFTGEAVFPNIDLNSYSSDAKLRNLDKNGVFVVTGASRGIGLQIVKDLTDRTKGTIVACCRNPQKAEKLHTMLSSLPEEKSNRISLHQLDLEDQRSIQNLAETIRSIHNRVDVLYNVAGILGDGSTTPGPERSLRSMNRDWALKSFNVNYLGPMFLSQACAPMMKRNTNEKTAMGNSVIACLSARVGSISDNGLGGWISYRSSKAALNQGVRTMAHELKRQGTYAITLHPGTTDTDLSKPFQKNVREDRLFPVDFTSGRIIDAVDCMRDEHTGGFYDWNGTALPF